MVVDQIVPGRRRVFHQRVGGNSDSDAHRGVPRYVNQDGRLAGFLRPDYALGADFRHLPVDRLVTRLAGSILPAAARPMREQQQVLRSIEIQNRLSGKDFQPLNPLIRLPEGRAITDPVQNSPIILGPAAEP